MTETLQRVRELIIAGEVEVSRHGLFELAADGILLDDVIAGLGAAVTIEDYPAARHGPSALTLQHDKDGRAIHIVWGIAKGANGPAVLVTAYRPDPKRWLEDFRRRR